VGGHLVEGLLARGETNITVFDITESSLFHGQGEVQFIKGDIRNYEDVKKACVGMDTIFHTAAVINFWSRLQHDYQQSYDVNFEGTKNVLQAAMECGVKQLIYTSSYVVTFDTRLQKIENGDESLPYASPPYLNHYVATKIPAEKAVLEANGTSGLKTGALRPTGGIFGPRDNVLTRMWKENEGGQIFFIGIGHTKQDWIYVENVVHSHLCMEAKMDTDEDVDGKAYFVSNNEPLTCLDMYTRFGDKFRCKLLVLPMLVLYLLAYCSEFISYISKGSFRGKFFFLTPSTLVLPRTELYFNCRKAEEQLGYKPIISFDAGLRNTYEYCSLFGPSNSEITKGQ